MARAKPAAGEGQLPLFLPDSTWQPPTTLPDLRRVDDLVIDVENKDDGIAAGKGSGWPYNAGNICGIAAAWYEDKTPKSIYIPMTHPDSQCHDKEAVKQWLKDHFAPGGPTIITHHGSHDWGWLWAEFGLKHADVIDDTEAMAVFVDENRFSYRLDDLCKWRGIPGKNEQLLKEVAAAYQYKGKDVKGNMWRFPARYVGPYAEQDGVAELMLATDLRPVLHEEQTWDAYRLEMDLMPVIHEMRRRGVRVDMKFAKSVKGAMEVKRDEALAELSDLVGQPMTMKECRSPKFLENIFAINHISFPRTAKTQQGSFTADWMRDHEHWLPRLVSRAEQLESAASKFVQGYLIDYAVEGRLHATVNQFRGEEGGTKSHRFSYSDPPLQQMPARDEEFARAIRGIFQPEEGEVWLSADYSQQEYRLIVHYAELANLTRATEAGDMYRTDPDTDFHKLVVDWTGLDRRSAKNANFAKSYGAGIKKFAAMIGKDEDEAKRVYNKYDKELPFVSQLGIRCQRRAEDRGYIKLCDGARSHFDLWEPQRFKEGRAVWGARPLDKARQAWPGEPLRRFDARKAMNRLIQGGAARQTKAAIRLCHRAGYVPMLQMHDELCFSITSQKQADEITELMREAAKMTIPSKVDAEFGKTWGDAKHEKFDDV